MRNRQKGVAGLLALTLAAASAVASVGMAAAQDDDGPAIGVSWKNFEEERWALRDEPAIKDAIEAAGGTYISTDAASSAEKQLTDIEHLVNEGAQAIIVLAQDVEIILPGVAAALDAGVPVVAYDRLLEDPRALYVTFDNVEVGRMQARAILANLGVERALFGRRAIASRPSFRSLFASDLMSKVRREWPLETPCRRCQTGIRRSTGSKSKT